MDGYTYYVVVLLPGLLFLLFNYRRTAKQPNSNELLPTISIRYKTHIGSFCSALMAIN